MYPKIIRKLIFLWKNPRIIVIKDEEIIKVVSHLLKRYFTVGILKEKIPDMFNIIKNKILIFNQKNEDFSFLFKNSRQPVLVIKEIENNEEFIKLIKDLPDRAYLVLNFDNPEVRNLKKETVSNILTFGFYEGADIRATDINSGNEMVNFKLNYEGGFIPVWLKASSEMEEKETIYSTLIVASIGTIVGLNLVEISQSLKS